MVKRKSSFVAFRLEDAATRLLDDFVADAKARGAKVSPGIAARALLLSALNVPAKRARAMELVLMTYRAQRRVSTLLNEIMQANLPALLEQSLSEPDSPREGDVEEPERVAGLG